MTDLEPGISRSVHLDQHVSLKIPFLYFLINWYCFNTRYMYVKIISVGWDFPYICKYKSVIVQILSCRQCNEKGISGVN